MSPGGPGWPGASQNPRQEAGAPSKAAAPSRLTDVFQEGQSSLSEPGRDELASPPWPRVSCRTVSHSQIRCDNQLLLRHGLIQHFLRGARAGEGQCVHMGLASS